MKSFKNFVKMAVAVGLLSTSLFASDNLDKTSWDCIVTSIFVQGDKEIKLTDKEKEDSIFRLKMKENEYIIDNNGAKFNYYKYKDTKDNIDFYEDKEGDDFIVGTFKNDGKYEYFNFVYISKTNPNTLIKGICLKVNNK
jgi:predicted glutamine amidotransferase